MILMHTINNTTGKRTSKNTFFSLATNYRFFKNIIYISCLALFQRVHNSFFQMVFTAYRFLYWRISVYLKAK